MNTFLDPQILLSQAMAPQNTQERNRNNPESLKKIAQEFESLLIHSMMKSMREATTDGGLLPKGVDQEAFESLMDMEIARQAAYQNTSNISEALIRQLGPHHTSPPRN